MRTMMLRLMRTVVAAVAVMTGSVPIATATTGLPLPQTGVAFCPTGFALVGATCRNRTGQTVLPATRGDAYRTLKAAHDPQTLCNAWDIVIMTQIEDFGTEEAFPVEELVAARLRREEAQRLMHLDRYVEALAIYETIFAHMQP